MLPRHARCVLSRLRCNGHSFFLGSYLSKIGRVENPFCSACGHPSQDTSHLILHCPATDSWRRSLFGDSLSLYDLWSRPWGVAGFWGSMVFHHAPIPRKGSGNQQQLFILYCLATDSYRRSLFGDSLSICDLWCKPWVVIRLGVPWCFAIPPPLKWDWVTTTRNNLENHLALFCKLYLPGRLHKR